MISNPKKKVSRKVSVAVVVVNAKFNNTHVTFSDLTGNVLCWSSAGKCGLKGSRKGTPYGATLATDEVAKVAMESFGVKTVSVLLCGPGPGREASVQALAKRGLTITLLKDITPLPHNGCRPPKRRRM